MKKIVFSKKCLKIAHFPFKIALNWRKLNILRNFSCCYIMTRTVLAPFEAFTSKFCASLLGFIATVMFGTFKFFVYDLG